MLRYQLQDAQADSALVSAAGVVATSQQFTDYINEAQRRLIRRGEWFDLDQVVSFCVSGCVIAWPRWVGSILGVRFGKGKPAQIYNNYFSFVGPHHRHSGFHSDAVIEDCDMGPCANEITGTSGKYLQYYAVLPQDLGKTITVFGTQYGGQPLQEIVNGVVRDGQTITLASPFGTSSPVLVTRIDAITRQATAGTTSLFECDPVSGQLRDLAFWEPGETNPRNRRSIIRNKPFNCGEADANGIHWTKLEALIKVEFIPVLNPRDFLLVDNFDALKFMIQAIKAEEANDDQTAEAKILKSIRELNFELRSKNSDDQMPVRVNSVMGKRISNPY